MSVVGAFLRIVIFLIAGGWLLTILYAQFTCSLFTWIGTQCHGDANLVWLYPFVTAIIGIPALVIASMITAVRWGLRN
jgi:hypothetical protein